MKRPIRGIACLSLACIGACDAGGPISDDPSPLPELVEGSECRTREGSAERVYLWRAGERRLDLAMDSATTQGLRPSVFVHRLDAQDRLLGKEQLVEGVAEWRHLYELDDRGNPTGFTYEWQGAVASRTEFRNTYDGDRLMATEVVEQGQGPPRRSWRSYEYDAQGRRTRARIEIDQRRERPVETSWSFDDLGRLTTIQQIHLHGERGLTTFSYGPGSRLLSSVSDGGPYIGNTDGKADVTTTWTYDARGRLTRRQTRGAFTDVGAPGTQRSDETFQPGCAAFQARFPGIFDQPAELHLR